MKITTEKSKMSVGIMFGGESAEHEVSVLSARSVLQAIDREKFEPYLIGVDKNGHLHLVDTEAIGVNANDLIHAHSLGRLHIGAHDNGMRFIHSDKDLPVLDVIFPVTHGSKGEDGTLQGLLELMSIPYVGPGVLGSAIGMDKDVSKRLLREAGLQVADHFVLRRSMPFNLNEVALDYPLFVKPANLGSSIGVYKARDKKELLIAIEDAFRHDRKIVIEKSITGDEIECAVMGVNHNPVVSVPGRINYKTDFYDYAAKYDATKETTLEIPASLSPKVKKRVQQTAHRAYQVLECEGLARIDMFVTSDGEVYVNEVNTLPGLTEYSMYPKLWEATGVSYTQLITKLVQMAISHHQKGTITM